MVARFTFLSKADQLSAAQETSCQACIDPHVGFVSVKQEVTSLVPMDGGVFLPTLLNAFWLLKEVKANIHH